MSSVRVEESTLAPGLKIIKKETSASSRVKKKKVAAYCRVSTDKEEQESSLETQMESYEKMISEHPEWELAGIYADKGITGTSVKHRKDFLRMMDDAQAGKIDIILAKSISRFARNTLDTLEYTRKLRALGVVVYFEKENINTGDLTSEMLLTIYAAFSQEESLSISRNLKTGIRSRFRLGKPMHGALYGYNIPAGWTINEEEAKIVRRIYEEVLQGYSTDEIAERLNSDDVPTFHKNSEKWSRATIGVIVANEKYIGNVLMQKYLIRDHLSHKHIKNDGSEVEQYFLENHHEAIVDQETYDLANETLKRRQKQKGVSQYPYYSFMTCPFCGKPMVAVKTNTSSKSRYWICPGRCREFALRGNIIHAAMLNVVERLRKDWPGEKALQSGRVSYAFLAKYVKNISFPDFHTMEITLRDGSILRQPIQFGGGPEDFINLPTLDVYQAEHICFVNGIRVNQKRMRGCLSRQAAMEYMKIEWTDNQPYPQVTVDIPENSSDTAWE